MFKIMIVEDDQTIATLIAQALRKWQLSAVKVTDFSKVYDQFVAEQPHLVLLDINLPVYDGYHWSNRSAPTRKSP